MSLGSDPISRLIDTLTTDFYQSLQINGIKAVNNRNFLIDKFRVQRLEKNWFIYKIEFSIDAAPSSYIGCMTPSLKA